MVRILFLLAATILLTACAAQDDPAQAADAGLVAIPTVAYSTGTALPTVNVPVTITAPPTDRLTLVLPTLTSYPDDNHLSLGLSVEGREIWAWQFGEGPYTIVLVGGIHGG